MNEISPVQKRTAGNFVNYKAFKNFELLISSWPFKNRSLLKKGFGQFHFVSCLFQTEQQLFFDIA